MMPTTPITKTSTVQTPSSEYHLICAHGRDGNPQRNWWPWLKKQAESLGLRVDIPQLPGGENPQLPQWVKIIDELVGNETENTILVGHSLGCDAILRYVERILSINSDNSKNNAPTIAGMILVAPYFDETDINDLKDFGGKPIDVQKVKQIVEHKVAIFSDNDPHVPLQEGVAYQQRVGSKIIILKNRGHFTQEDGCTQLPQVLNAIKDIIK